MRCPGKPNKTSAKFMHVERTWCSWGQQSYHHICMCHRHTFAVRGEDDLCTIGAALDSTSAEKKAQRAGVHCARIACMRECVHFLAHACPRATHNCQPCATYGARKAGHPKRSGYQWSHVVTLSFLDVRQTQEVVAQRTDERTTQGVRDAFERIVVFVALDKDRVHGSARYSSFLTSAL